MTTCIPDHAPTENISAYQSSFTDAGKMHFRYEQPAGSEVLDEGFDGETSFGLNDNVCYDEGMHFFSFD